MHAPRALGHSRYADTVSDVMGLAATKASARLLSCCTWMEEVRCLCVCVVVVFGEEEVKNSGRSNSPSTGVSCWLHPQGGSPRKVPLMMK